MRLDVRTWLEEQGLGQYAELFHAHAVDGAVLHLLTEAHLRDMGLPLGHRLKLLDAIAALAGSADAAPAAERRRLTVMFVDLVGSTALSRRLDPEDLREVIRGYQETITTETLRFEAHVARYLGDGALVYFGWPRAHEDDAERAVRAALGIVRAVSARRDPTGEPLAVRVGIATGLVVVGDLLGAGAATERAVLGDTPNLAARLQQLAGPGEIVVSAQTRALAGRHFRWRALPPREVKGVDEPVASWRVVGERTATRFEARRDAPLHAMVGRHAELERLVSAWRDACRGHGRAILVTGEAGIGKSRLVRALEQALAREPYLAIVNQCSPHRTESPLHPMIQQMVRAAGLRPGITPDDALDRLEAMLQPGSPEEIALVASLLGLDGSARYGRLEMTPEQQRLRTFEALLAQVKRASREQTVLWVLEDAHWIDPTSLDMLAACLDRIGDARILAVVTARPEFGDRLGAPARLERLSLQRLTAGDATTLVSLLASGHALPAELVAEIAARADGVPLFVEEITKTVLEEGAAVETSGDGAPRRWMVPASLHDSMMARLDRHPALKEVAQAAACIGREFDGGLLQAASGLPPEVVRDGLARLSEAGLVSRRRSQDEVYVFKHALVRDAAYESLLRSRRQVVHGRLLEALATGGDAAPELLAHHACEAGLPELAMGYWREAGLAALARPAYQEACAHLRQALRVADAMPTARETQLELLLLLGQAIIPLRGYSHSESVEVFTRAAALVDALGESPHRFTVSHAMWVAFYVRGEHGAALRIAHDLLERARANGSASRMLAALRTLGIGQMITGEVPQAWRTFEEAKALAIVVRSQARTSRIAVAQRFAADPDIATEFHVALTAAALGELERGRKLATDALAAARAMGHVHTLGHALVHAAIVASVLRDRGALQALAGEALAFANEHDMDLWRGYASILQAKASILGGEPAEACPAMDRGFRFLARTEAGTMVPASHAAYALALAQLGRWDSAEREAALVEAELRNGCQRYWWPEALRWLGDMRALRADGAAGDPAADYQRALALAAGQGSHAFALGAGTGLAAWWQGQGRLDEARALLAPLVDAVVLPADCPLVHDATALLETLRKGETQPSARVSNLV